MKKSLFKILCIVVVFAVIFVTAAGCGGKKEKTKSEEAEKQETSTETSTSDDKSIKASLEAGSNELEWKSMTDPIKFTAFVDFNPNPWDGWGTDPVTQEISKRTGVSVDIKVATTTEHEELNAMIASGDLPDFIILNGDGPLRSTLWKQGFVQPLNKLMDKYAPKMWNIMPKDMDKIWKESDGNLYYLAGYYSDFDRIMALKGIQQTVSGVTINMPMYEKLGKPLFKTLDDYKKVLKMAKEQLKDVPYIVYDQRADSPADDQRNMAQLINRIYGGGNTKTITDDGTVHLNLRDETYLKAIKYINGLYREGLFNPENFTTLKQEQYNALIQNQKVFSAWGQPFDVYKFDMTEKGPYKPVVPPQETGIDLKWRAAATQIGGWPLAAISSKCKDPERAILYFEFLLSDEGQMLTYHGIEGIHYTMVDGMPKNQPEKDKMWGEKFSDVQSKLGIINYQVAWFPTNWSDMLYYYWLNDSKPTYKVDTEINNVYARNERMNELIKVESDSDEKVIETKVYELWKTMLPKMYLAETEEKCVEAYNELIAKAEKLGLKDLEKAYTDSYRKWVEILK